jgi:hypothetical protein
MMRRSLIAWCVVLGLIAASCGGDDADSPSSTAAPAVEAGTFPADAFAIRANLDLAVGTGRLLVGVAQPDGTRLGSPDDPVVLEVRPVDDLSAPVQRLEAGFVWIVPDVVGLYRGVFEFDRPGTWQVVVIPEEGSPLEPAPFSVLDPSCRLEDAADRGIPVCALQVGDPAPLVGSPTLEDAPIEELTTDPAPDERLYRLSLEEALTNGRRTVVVFATPAFCQTAACGPLLDTVKTVVGQYPDTDFVHVEVYTGFREPDFDPTDPERLAPAVDAFRLVSEPWVFVVDERGTITARFEGAMDVEELLPHLR